MNNEYSMLFIAKKKGEKIMSNMGYCRFHNTVQDLYDVKDHLQDTDLSESESDKRKELLNLCKRIVSEEYPELVKEEIYDTIDY